jgi:beta-lactamase regulating signal transducer with metallopeptidase domain
MFILYLLSLMLRSLVLAAFAGATLVLTKKVAVRHAAWTLVLCFMFLMPIADAFLPAALVPSTVPEVVRPIQGFILYSAIPSPQHLTSETTPAVAQTDWWRVAAILIVAITLGLLVRLILVFRQVARLRRTSHVIPDATWDSVTDISLRESGSITTPLTVGVWKPLLILPVTWRDWDEWKLRAVLTHERTHVKRGDWAVAVIGSIAKCLYWFNPLVWWLERKLSSLAEQACDEACVCACGDAPRYAETLLEFASAASLKHRLVGGVAMAQYRISQRIERVLALRRPGSGVLPRPAWALLLVLTLPTLYVSAASQAPERMPVLSPEELRQFFQPLLVPVTIAAIPQEAPRVPASETRQSPTVTPTREVGPAAPSPAVPPAPPQQVSPVTPDPDLVGEIRLILAPVEVATQTPGQVQIQTRAGTNQFTGTAVWNIANGALSPSTWNANTFWNVSNSAFAFALTGIQGRKAFFQDQNGNTFSYGCPNCAFFVSQSGVGSLPANPDLGITFGLSTDGKLLSVTCHARECRLGSIIGNTTATGALITLLVNSQTASIGVAQSPAATCFNILGNNKADGSPFTDADCLSGVPTELFFSVTR